MSLPYRPEPPTDAVFRGKARLLAELSAIAAEPDAARGTDDDDEECSEDGRYVFGEVVAAGGLGVVRRGEDRRLGRPIAIKELLRESPRAARRFALEAAITARLQHPSIVPLYDLGWLGEGKPYYCMKLVDGDSLEARIAGAEQLGERLRLIEHVIDVADAIAYAHEQQIIHRDIKPANVLVGGFGETVVIDWGLAKDLSGTILTELDADLGSLRELDAEQHTVGGSDMTEAGTVMGTLRYMSPEQARGEVVDARSDVYSLGALLYHVLAGSPPFAGGDRHELVRRVLAGNTEPLRSLEPAIPPELAAVAERAMAVEPEQRYESALAFAEDLRRFQTGGVVSAHYYSLAEVGRRWLRRHRGIAGAGAATLLGVGVVALLATREIQAEREALEAAELAAAAEAARAERVEFEGAVLDESRRAAEVLSLARTPGRELEALARGVELVAGHARDLAGVPEPTYDGLSLALAGLIPVARLDRPEHQVFSIGALSPDGSLVVTLPWRSADTRGQLQLWSTHTAERRATITLADADDAVWATALSPDNRLLATSDQTSCTIYEVATGAPVHELSECAAPHFSVDGSSLFAKVPGAREAGAQLYGALRAWDVDSWTPRWTTPVPGKNFSVLVHPDAKRVIVRRDQLSEEAVELLDVADGSQLALLFRPHAGRGPRTYSQRSPGFTRPESLALSPDGRSLAVSETDADARVVVWDLDTFSPTVLGLDGGIVRDPLFSANGRQLYVGVPTIEGWDLVRNQQIAMLPTPSQLVRVGPKVLALGDGEWIELPRGRAHQPAPPERPRALEASRDGRFLVTASDAGVRLWSAADHLALEIWPRPEGEVVTAFSATEVVTHGADGRVRIHARADARPPVLVAPELGERMVIARAAARPSIVATRSEGGADNGSVDIHDLASGELRCHIGFEAIDTWALRFDHAGERVLVADDAGMGHLWELDSCREQGELVALYDPDALQPASLPFRFAVDGTLVVYRPGHILLRDRDGHDTRIADDCGVHNPWGDAQLAPDGRRLLSWCSSSDRVGGDLRIWDVGTGEVVASVDASGYTGAPVFTRDGRRVVFVAGRRELAVVDVDDGREILRIPTADIDATYTTLGVSEDGDSVEVLSSEVELVRYPVTRAGLVDAACRVLRRSELAGVCAAAGML